MRWGYPLELVPEWCRMPAAGHQDGVGGCWSLSHGLVAARGEAACRDCDFYAAPDVVVDGGVTEG